MCGIAGFAGLSIPVTEASARVRRMCDAIRHRGPDSDGYHVADGVALGMRRLSIIDVSGGRQPIYNEDRSVSVVFNGEIYNHHALRRELQDAGHDFRTASDTEVLVHLYEQHGTAMVGMLQGMFAFAIWDASRRTLLLARDHVGMKPLSYRIHDNAIVFCSELRSLLALDPSAGRVSPESIVQYLAFGYVPDPASIFQGVYKLPPGSFLEWNEERGASIHRYWSAPRERPNPYGHHELVSILRERLDSAVAAHLESEVPLGAFLSGGLDSSTVVALMCRHARGRVRTFSIGFAEDAYDESAAASEVAAALGTNHTTLVLRPDVQESFEAIAQMFDEPFADSSAIPTFFVSQLARQHVTVALSGDAGDELFGGYSRYRQVLSKSAGALPLIGQLLAATGRALPHFFPGRNRLVDLGRSRWGRYASTVLQPVRVDEGGLARADRPGAGLRLSEHFDSIAARNEGDDFAAAIMRADLESYLPGDILTKVDRTTMANSLEARVPFLDVQLVDFALRLPGEYRVTADESKRLFRSAIRGLVPDFVLSRPKRGFEVPLGQWFRGPLRDRLQSLRHPSANLHEYIEPDALRRIVTEHVVGRRDHSGVLWRVMVLEAWLAALREGKLSSPPALPRLRV